MLTLCTVGHIIYDDPYDGWVLQDEAMFDQVQLKALAPGLYEGMTPSRRSQGEWKKKPDSPPANRCDPRGGRGVDQQQMALQLGYQPCHHPGLHTQPSISLHPQAECTQPVGVHSSCPL